MRGSGDGRDKLGNTDDGPIRIDPQTDGRDKLGRYTGDLSSKVYRQPVRFEPTLRGRFLARRA